MLCVIEKIHNTAANPPRLFLKEWRDKLKLSQEQIAARLETDKGTISKLERGRQKVTDDWLFGLAWAMGVEPERLFRHPDAPSLDDLIRGAPDNLKKQIFQVVEALVKTGTGG